MDEIGVKRRSEARRAFKRETLHSNQCFERWGSHARATISATTSWFRNRWSGGSGARLIVGADADIERDIAKLPQTVADVQVRESSHVASVSVDSAWLRHCDSERGLGRHVNIVAGRATFMDGTPKLYAYVHKEVLSAAARLDQFLSRNGVATDERLT
jgi:hypothetical protein